MAQHPHAHPVSLATRHTLADAWIQSLDSALRTVLAPAHGARATPIADGAEARESLSESEKALSGALMRVNHVGEVCAQALYTSQALGARLFSREPALAAHLEHASQEETDHLAWTEERIQQLNTHPSYLNPVWYAGAFAIGLAASAMGRQVSLGFVVETERQVEAHLESHLTELPANDAASRAIVVQMKADEIAHAKAAQQMGAVELPSPVQWLMRKAARVMTTVAHHI